MDQVLVTAIAIATGISILILISLGLAVIFGMMRIINFAHGEFIMLGAYTTVLSTNAGINLWISMLIIAPAFVAGVGLVCERLLIRQFYGNLTVTMLMTWGLSLFLVGAVTAIFGNTTRGIAAPLGNVAFGNYSVSVYQLFLIAFAALLVLAAAVFLTRTRFGLIARGTMQNPAMASALGIDPGRVYAATFAIGAALSGLAGGLLAPMSGVLPNMGASYVAKAFVTVIAGGSSVLFGMTGAAFLFGPIEALVSLLSTPVIGQASLLAAAILLLRLMPMGLSAGIRRTS